MFYSIRHKTRFRYSAPISESVMEVRMQPRSEGPQRCHKFQLSTVPRARIFAYRDYQGNAVHHFNVPGRYIQLTITAESLVEMQPPPPLPAALDPGAWDELDAQVASDDYWEMLMPSQFARPTALLADLARELDLRRGADPLTTLHEINSALARLFEYAPDTTHVHSPIDHALELRQGVCQDFAHIMIALVRQLRIPCRYVSGYLFHRREDHDRSEDDASHAWVEALLPGLGWVGFDPTNNLIAGERHIRTAVGRDYADVPPTRGVFKGSAQSDLDVAVQVSPTEAPPPDEDLPPVMPRWTPADAEAEAQAQLLLQQQQQQQ